MDADSRIPAHNPPEGFRVVEEPIQETGVEILGPNGESLALFPCGKIWVEGSRGAWPRGSTILKYMSARSGRRITLAHWTWTGSEREELDLPTWHRLRVFPDYGMAYAWDQYGRPGEFAELLPDRPTSVNALDRAFTAWYEEWNPYDPFDPSGNKDITPEDGWDGWKERGLRLCHWLLSVIGPEGLIIYRNAPECFGCGNEGLAIYMERQ